MAGGNRSPRLPRCVRQQRPAIVPPSPRRGKVPLILRSDSTSCLLHVRAKLRTDIEVTVAKESVFSDLNLTRYFLDVGACIDDANPSEAFYGYMDIQRGDKREMTKVFCLPVSKYWEGMQEDLILGYKACKLLISPNEALYRDILDFE